MCLDAPFAPILYGEKEESLSASGRLNAMRSGSPRIIVPLVLLICLVCPFLEMFDHWDHTLQTGSDTEYTLVLVALCVGFACSVARLVFTASRRSGIGVKILSEAGEFKTFVSIFRGGIQLASSISPPLVRLRI